MSRILLGYPFGPMGQSPGEVKYYCTGGLTLLFENPCNAFEMLKIEIQSYYEEFFIISRVVYGP